MKKGKSFALLNLFGQIRLDTRWSENQAIKNLRKSERVIEVTIEELETELQKYEEMRERMKKGKSCFTCVWYRDFPKQCRRVLNNFHYKSPDGLCGEYKSDKTIEELSKKKGTVNEN